MAKIGKRAGREVGHSTMSSDCTGAMRSQCSRWNPWLARDASLSWMNDFKHAIGVEQIHSTPWTRTLVEDGRTGRRLPTGAPHDGTQSRADNPGLGHTALKSAEDDERGPRNQ
jgi:hypothetical protein